MYRGGGGEMKWCVFYYFFTKNKLFVVYRPAFSVFLFCFYIYLAISLFLALFYFIIFVLVDNTKKKKNERLKLL